MNLSQMLASNAYTPEHEELMAAGGCQCNGACNSHVGACARRSMTAGACETCAKLIARQFKAEAGPNKVQAPSDVTDEKGVLPVGNWIGESQSPTTIATPRALVGTMAMVHDNHGNLASEKLLSNVMAKQSKFLTDVNMVAGARSVSAATHEHHAGEFMSSAHKTVAMQFQKMGNEAKTMGLASHASKMHSVARSLGKGGDLTAAHVDHAQSYVAAGGNNARYKKMRSAVAKDSDNFKSSAKTALNIND